MADSTVTSPEGTSLPPEDKVGKRVHAQMRWNFLGQEPITRSLHTCCTLESSLSSGEIFLQQAFAFDKLPRTLSAIVVKASSEHKKLHVNEHD